MKERHLFFLYFGSAPAQNFRLVLYRAPALCLYHSKKRVHKEQFSFDLSLFQHSCLLKKRIEKR